MAEDAASYRAELEELYNAVVLDKLVHYDGRWGMATLEVCLAIMQSAAERREISLSHQVPAPATDNTAVGHQRPGVGR